MELFGREEGLLYILCVLGILAIVSIVIVVFKANGNI